MQFWCDCDMYGDVKRLTHIIIIMMYAVILLLLLLCKACWWATGWWKPDQGGGRQGCLHKGHLYSTVSAHVPAKVREETLIITPCTVPGKDYPLMLIIGNWTKVVFEPPLQIQTKVLSISSPGEATVKRFFMCTII